MLRSIIFSTIFLPFLLSSCGQETEQITHEKVIIGYVPGFRGELDETTIAASKLTHINYAFVDVRDSMAWLTNVATDTINFRRLNRLKKINPDLKILISIGGWSWSENFSDAVLTESSRDKFARTSVSIVEEHDLDGVDIDWEYPGQRGEDNIFRPEDKQNYTLMFKSIREKLDELSARTGKTYELTTAVGASMSYILNTEMDKAQEYLDYVNLMTYDFYTSGDSAGHHTNLFPPENYDKDRSAHRTFNEFLAAGVPAEKMVMGIAFYGRSWIMQSGDNRGINRPVVSVTRGGGYTYLKDSMLILPGFLRYWDENAKAPYLFNEETHQFVSYDDEESVKYKCEYVKEKGMAGVMFWQYASDPKEYLLDAINENL
ncbi:MAG: glycoside hydrolase family 18 protein [Cyclobacteriaceae bacterium]|nr:glycoside hydrolase family 18 protein [Cyclobacteriaceae bacterium]